MSVVLLGGKLTNMKKSERPLVEGGLAVKPIVGQVYYGFVSDQT